MRLLIVDPDRRLAELISSVAQRDGHDVWSAHDGLQAKALVAQHPPEVILVALDLGPQDGPSLINKLVKDLDQKPEIILTSSSAHRHDPRVQSALQTMDAIDFLRQPLSVLNLMDTLRRLNVRQHKTNTARPTALPRILNQKSLALIGGVWAKKRSGKISFRRRHGFQQVMFMQGGVSNKQDLKELERLLYSGPLSFHELTMQRAGLWREVGEVLWKNTVDADQHISIEANKFRALYINYPKPVCTSLPLAEVTREIIRKSTSSAILGELLAHFTTHEREAISRDLHALERMQFISFQAPTISTTADKNTHADNVNLQRFMHNPLEHFPDIDSDYSYAEDSQDTPRIAPRR